MASGQADTLLRHIRNLVDAETTKGLTDAQLIERFAAHREESAFVALMQRHGRLVWSVCQHLLHREQDAEDAFQATFLVLARRAGSIRKTEAVGSWLYGVAYRIAMKASKSARKRQAHERRVPAKPQPQAATDLGWRELQTMLDEEVQRLPEKYRAPFVLCCLEGRIRKEVASELGCNEGTISSRIARARRLLQQRLARRGVTLSATLCACVLWKQTAAAAVPAALAANTVKAAAGAAEYVSTTALALADGAVRAIGLTRWHVGALLLLGFGLLTAGAGVGSRFLPVIPQAEAMPEAGPAAPATVGKDLHGDPLPRQALARLGTLRQRAADSHLAVTADGKEVIAVSGDLTVRRFDAETGELHALRQLPGSRPILTWLSPHGSFVLASSVRQPLGYVLELWQLAQGKRLQTLSVGRSFPCGAAFSADEGRLAVAAGFRGDDTHKVLVWDLKTAKSQVLWSEPKEISPQYFEPVVALSPDGKRVVACHLDLILRCWQVDGGKLLWESKTKNWSPYVFFSPDGQKVVAGANISTAGINLLDAATGRLIEVKRPPAEAVFPIGYSPDGKLLAFETGFDEVVLWAPGKARAAFQVSESSRRRDTVLNNSNHLPTNFAFTPDSKGLIRRFGALQRWDLTTGKTLYPDMEKWGHTEAVTRLLFSPNGRFLASSSQDKTVRLWEVAAARTLQVFSKGPSDHLAFMPDSRHLLTATPFGIGKTALQVWNVSTGRAERGLELSDRDELRASGGDIRVTADGRKVLMLTWKNGRTEDESVLSVWNAVTDQCLVHRRVPWAEDSLLLPDGEGVLALDSRTGLVRLLTIETGKPRLEFQSDRNADPQRTPLGCAFALSPNGRLMASRIRFFNRTNFQQEDDDLRVGDMTTGRQVLKLSFPGPAVFAFSADDRLLAVAGTEGIRLWEVASWKEVGSIKAPDHGAIGPRDGFATSIAFSPDGRTLATGHPDSTILLWDATLRGGTRGGPLTAAQWEAQWAELAGADAARAYAAVWQLVDDPQRSISTLKERLKPVAPPSAEVVQSLLEDLDSSQFRVREAAGRKLRFLGDLVESALCEALQANPSLEKKQRLNSILAALNPCGPLTGEPLRGLRAVQVLERIGSPDARRILEQLAQGVESARMTRAAKESLARMIKL